MKKWISAMLTLLLAAQLLVMTGCGQKQSTQTDSNISDPKESFTAEDTAAINTGLERIGAELELSDTDLDSIEATTVQHYGNETVVRYTQNYRGVEIYGSSILVTAGDESYCAGTYYDLSEAFGDDFEQLVQSAQTAPEWMKDVSSGNVALTYDKSTHKPVIYITKEGEAILAHSVETKFSMDGESIMLSLILSQDGTLIYECNSLENFDYFTDVSVNGNYNIDLSKEGGTYYAYNSEYNFYGINMIGSSEKAEKAAKRYSKYDDSLHRRTVEMDRELMYKSNSKDWSTGESEIMLTAMAQFYNVAKWYDDNFAWSGLNGDNSLSAVLVVTEGGSLAANFSNVIVIMNTEVVKGPEVLAHEFCHSVFQGTTNTPNPADQAAALNEAISDAFAALYLGDGSWHLAKNTSQSKNIPKMAYTMDDYVYDRYALTDPDILDSVNPLFWADWIGVFLHEMNKNWGWEIEWHTGSSSKCHENSFIVSHALYGIWDKVFKRNDDGFGQVLFRSLRYVPSNPGFSEFRDAFLFSMSQSYSTDDVAYASTFFDVAGIFTAGSSNIKRMKVQAASEKESSLLGLYNMNYGEIRKLAWDEFVHIGGDIDTPAYEWYFSGSINDISIGIHFEAEELNDSCYPTRVDIFDPKNGALSLPITPDIKTGDTYGHIDSLFHLSPYPEEWGGPPNSAYFYLEQGCIVTLSFDGPGDLGVLTSASIEYFE